MRQFLISASILSADFARLGEECDKVIAAGADHIHFDVMDNHYVPALTFGPMICEALRKHGVKAPISVHLMVEPVDSLIIEFAKAGASAISFHPEASKHVDRSLNLIQSFGCEAGLALNPTTSLSVLEYCWHKLNFVLLMSVNPGFGGQEFIETMLVKAKQVKAMIDAQALKTRIEMDGGIKLDNIATVAKAGVDTFISGSGIFKTEDYQKTIDAMREKLKGIKH